MSGLYIPDASILLTKQVERFAAKLTDDKEQQKEILNLWNDTVNKNAAPSTNKRTKNLIEKAGIVAVKMLSGYMVDPTTKLAFDSNKMVIGKEIKGKIEPLTTDDMTFCDQQKIEMRVPPRATD